MLVRVGAVRVSGGIGRAELYDLNSVSPVVRCFMMLEEGLTGSEVLPRLKTFNCCFVGFNSETMAPPTSPGATGGAPTTRTTTSTR